MKQQRIHIEVKVQEQRRGAYSWETQHEIEFDVSRELLHGPSAAKAIADAIAHVLTTDDEPLPTAALPEDEVVA